MILDIPSSDDFKNSGITFLNLAWDRVQEILSTLDQADIADWDSNDEKSEEFWRSVQKPLFTSLALVQQATEFLLKGKIVEVSPFLLITGDPRSWPKGCDRVDVQFADFRTVDAQDLIRVVNTVSNERLDDTLVAAIEELRRARNRIMHSVDNKFRTNPRDIVLTILEIFQNFIIPCGWNDGRRDYLINHFEAVAFWTTEHVESKIAQETLFVSELINKAAFKRYYGVDLKKRRYHCPDCNHECKEYSEIEPMLAQLLPNTPDSTTLHCYLCGTDREVVRKNCNNSGCKGNVIDAKDNLCLLCLEDQD